VLVDKHLMWIPQLEVQTIRDNPDHLRSLQIHQVLKQSLLLVVVLVELEDHHLLVDTLQLIRQD
tara:strand:+ start:143 stop:334 length:192 start_codon:yes stop_codon:yes gene_type:complete